MKESTSAPIDHGFASAEGLFEYEMYFVHAGEVHYVQMALPCLLQHAMTLGMRHFFKAERRDDDEPTSGYRKPTTPEKLAKYEIGLEGLPDEVIEMQKYMPKIYFFDGSALWIGSVRISIDKLFYAIAHVPENHPLHAKGLKIIGLDVDDEAAYKPLLITAKTVFNKTIITPAYGVIDEPCAALNERVITNVSRTGFLAYNAFVVNPEYVLQFSITPSTHDEHMRLAGTSAQMAQARNERRGGS